MQLRQDLDRKNLSHFGYINLMYPLVKMKLSKKGLLN